MQKFLVLFLLAISSLLADTQSDHLRKLRRVFPQGLLTDDFGVLNRQDLKINSCIAEPIPFSLNNSANSYPYWQCFETKQSSLHCEPGDYDPVEKSLMSMLILSGEKDGELHEYISRRPMALESCRLYERDWQKFTHDEKYVCISGASASMEADNHKKKWVWIFGRYKTKKGCDSYFDGECEGKGMCGE
ncbi:hypothetical protein EBT16_02335 [bacterium]|nr:hypothetical protein [bacterium]